MDRRPYGYMKYGNYRTEFMGRQFASKFEASVAGLWVIHQNAKLLQDMEFQVQVELTRAGIIYKPDFKAWNIGLTDEKGRIVPEGPIYGEAKGFKTPEWRIKRRLWTVYGPGPLFIYEGSAARPVLVEVLRPTG